MSDFRPVDKLFGFGLVGAFIVGGIALVELNVVKDKARIIEGILKAGSGGTASSPLHIRGGSMTAFTKGQGDQASGWKRQGSSWCTTLNKSDTSKIYGEQLDGTADGTIATTTPTIKWVITTYAHKPNDYTGAASDNEYMQFESQATDCDGKDQSKTSVMLSFHGNSEPYPHDLLNPGNYTGNKRFHDTDEDCSKDLDLCERMAKVVISFPPPTTGSSQVGIGAAPPKTFFCKGGNCSISVGQ